MTSQPPANAVHYASSPRFTEITTPEKLRNDHSVKAGTWGMLVLFSGRLIYRRPHSETTLAAGDTALIYPQELHSVEPLEGAEFEVRFYREDPADAA